MSTVPERTGVVIVFYFPNQASIELANRLARLCRCVVVDNTPCSTIETTLPGLDREVVYLANGENVGVATALNRGISELLVLECDCAILFDQDSEPDSDLIDRMPRLLDSLLSNGERLAMIGPAYVDARLGGITPFVRFATFWISRIAPEGNEAVDVDFLITSGSCINLKSWECIGPMEDSLFIDFVDLEWCSRARSKGYRVIGVPWLRMTHSLGDAPVMILGRPYPMHSPLRHYYMFRNAIALLRRNYMPKGWKVSELIKMPVRLVIYSTLTSERMLHLRMCVRGIWDGVLNRMGRGNFNEVTEQRN